MIRMVYFLHDVDTHQGPICFIPGSHKTCFEPPVAPGTLAEDEPGMIAIPVKAGDAVLFTESCRHGGVVNRSEQTRYTLHVGYGPDFLSSHNLSSQDAPMNVTKRFLDRLSPEQKALLVRKGLEPLARSL
jgi:ectoine hydroxylase-related dioxygenase (phytanoyl-CoA dioxygenase family)